MHLLSTNPYTFCVLSFHCQAQKPCRPGLYTELLFDGKLVSHLNDIDDTARQRMELLTRQMQEQHGVNEELKALDQMTWVGACNNIRNAAEEIVLNELIYC